MVEVEMPSWSFGDEELRIVRVVGRLRHRQDPGPVVLEIDVELIVKVAQRGTAVPLAGRITTLDHKIVDDPMEDDPVVRSRFPPVR